MREDAWDAYRWDTSMLDPTSQMPLSDPVRNKRCGHLYERSFMEERIKQGPSPGSKFKHIKCPYAVNIGKNEADWFGCTVDPISLSDLEPDVHMKEEIDKKKEERRAVIERYPHLKLDLYKKARRIGLVGISERQFSLFLHFGFFPSNWEHERMCATSLRNLGSGRLIKM